MAVALPTLYKTTSVGKIQQWNIITDDLPDGTASIITTHGQLNGKLQQDTVAVKEGKNLGKANATTAWQQAALEAESKWKKQKDKGYVDDIALLAGPRGYRPMLAKKMSEYEKKVKFPGYGQPKLDGIRCLAYKDGGDVKLLSRSNKFFDNLPHIQEALADMPSSLAFDGELYNHDVKFRDIISLTKRKQDDSVLMLYNCYDCITDAADGFAKRHATLVRELPKSQSLLLVETLPIASIDDMRAARDRWIAAKYEGGMYRTADGLYKQVGKSADLLKCKLFDDDEFKIIDSKEGVGREEGLIIFVCDLGNGNTVDVRPEGSHEERAAWWLDRASFVGKMLTVRYQGWTDSEPASLRFPVGTAIRDYE